MKILKKRTDGYHELFTVMKVISMYDTVSLRLNVGEKCISADKTSMMMPGISISCSDRNIPCDKNNTAYRAAELYFLYAAESANFINSIDITIEKRIPSQAGLGGGSSDAATVLLALNEVCENFLTEGELLEVASKVGADVAFFVKTKQKENSIAFCEGIGEIVTPVIPKANLAELKTEIIKPNCNISTKEAFEVFEKIKPDMYADIRGEREKVKNIFENGSVEDIVGVMKNDFEDIIGHMSCGEIKKEIDAAKADLYRRGAVAVQLSGSGSAVFGIFD